MSRRSMLICAALALIATPALAAVDYVNQFRMALEEIKTPLDTVTMVLNQGTADAKCFTIRRLLPDLYRGMERMRFSLELAEKSTDADEESRAFIRDHVAKTERLIKTIAEGNREACR